MPLAEILARGVFGYLFKQSSPSVDIPPTEEESGEIAELNAFASASHSTHKACKLSTSHSCDSLLLFAIALLQREHCELTQQLVDFETIHR